MPDHRQKEVHMNETVNNAVFDPDDEWSDIVLDESDEIPEAGSEEETEGIDAASACAASCALYFSRSS